MAWRGRGEGWLTCPTSHAACAVLGRVSIKLLFEFLCYDLYSCMLGAAVRSFLPDDQLIHETGEFVFPHPLVPQPLLFSEALLLLRSSFAATEAHVFASQPLVEAIRVLHLFENYIVMY